MLKDYQLKMYYCVATVYAMSYYIDITFPDWVIIEIVI